jgi:hypothetical protein
MRERLSPRVQRLTFNVQLAIKKNGMKLAATIFQHFPPNYIHRRALRMFTDNAGFRSNVFSNQNSGCLQSSVAMVLRGFFCISIAFLTIQPIPSVNHSQWASIN